jgi:hypothetical protein
MTNSVKVERRIARQYGEAPKIQKSFRDIGVVRGGGRAFLVNVECVPNGNDYAVRGANGIRWRIS